MANTVRKDGEANLPPMLRQYLDYKEQYPDSLLFFQVGDFYEAFFEDAELLARTLNVTLTSRSKNSENPVPMAGVPLAVIDAYMERLVNTGISVALVSQCSEATGKGMVERKLERVLTPGIRIAGNSDGASDAGPVVAVMCSPQALVNYHEAAGYAIAASTVQSGIIEIQECSSFESLLEELGRLAPLEVILPSKVLERPLDRRHALVRNLERLFPNAVFKFRLPQKQSIRQIQNIPGYSVQSSLIKQSVRLLCDYVDETIVETEIPFTAVNPIESKEVLLIDVATRANLDLIRNSKSGAEEGSLFSIMNATATPGGARLLRNWISAPLTGEKKIQARLDAVSALYDAFETRSEVRASLKFVGDLERLSARIELGLILPREMAALRNSLEVIPRVHWSLSTSIAADPLLSETAASLKISSEPYALLQQALVEQPPAAVKDGGFIRRGYDEQLDRAFTARDEGASWLVELEAKEKEATGISSLKIKHNNVLGYFFEVTRANLPKVPEAYIRKQTTTGGGRFFTEQLKEIEKEVQGADKLIKDREQYLLTQLREQLKTFAAPLRKLSEAVSTIDVLCGFAEIAEREDYHRPQITIERETLIKAGKHPVIERVLKGQFIPNDCSLSSRDKFALILTGPNMGGKSTYLRQIALLTIMAQCGSFIPVQEATIGIVDRLFARIGASDDLLEGESTFMVEMREAAHIIRHATSNSLVLVDELGRGTATLDGLSLARAIFEWVVEKKQSRIIFASHFHELTSLESRYESVGNICVGSVHRGEEVIFTHQIKAGAANRSYGLQVARLAGLPDDLLVRAQTLFKEYALETGAVTSHLPAPVEDLNCQLTKDLLRELASQSPDDLSPREALLYLYEIKKRAARLNLDDQCL